MLALSEKWPLSSSAAPGRKRMCSPAFVVGALIVILVFLCGHLQLGDPHTFCGLAYPLRFLSISSTAPAPRPTEVCPQVDALLADRNAHIWEASREQTASEIFKARAIDLHTSRRCPDSVESRGRSLCRFAFTFFECTCSTESYDDMQPVGVDPRWEIFGEFHKYLARTLPTGSCMSGQA
jgi:hypothetical protein